MKEWNGTMYPDFRKPDGIIWSKVFEDFVRILSIIEQRENPANIIFDVDKNPTGPTMRKHIPE